MRVAYLLMVHREPEQVRALLQALPSGSPVFVHVDARVRRATFESIAALQKERSFTLVTRHRCYWGRIGMVLATLELVRAALAADRTWNYASLMSGADYPIRSNDEVEQFLEHHRGREFISSWDLRAEGNPWRNVAGRFQAESRVDRQHFGAGRWIIRAPWNRQLPYGLHPHGGSQWWTLSRDALELLTGYVQTHPKLLPFMRGVFIPDECFVQTVLANSRLRGRITGDDLRFVIWNRPGGGPNPAILGAEDVSAMAESGKIYARKFDLRSKPGAFAEIDSRLRRDPLPRP